MSERKPRGERPRKIRYETGSARSRVIFLPVLALLLALAVELLNRGLSPVRLFQFVIGRPGYFLYGAMIILTTLVFSELFRRRQAVLASTALAWLTLGIVQYIVVSERTQPFCSVDILMLKDAFSLMTIYYTWPQIILMFGSGFALAVLIIAMFTRMKRRRKYNLPASLAAFVGFVLLTAMVAALGMRAGAFPRHFESMVDAYNDYGFATCFTFTFGQQGISRPEQYSAESVAEILTDIQAEPADGELVYPVFDEGDNLTHPNIVFLQLESFFDVNTVLGGEYSEDPTPWFNRLCERFPSGLLYVPTVGGGTANTEFEVITGLHLDFFGAGEYPYNTILQNTACETMCYNLRDYGYRTTAMHNNSASFYSRNSVYPNLGFERFVSLEYMRDVKYTPLGWAKDAGLTDEILRALESTPGRDLVMCITVESHGKYGEAYTPREGDIEVLALPEALPLAPFQNYVNALPNTDAFLESLINKLSNFREPTVVVAYGDHLPALNLSEDMLNTGSIYATQYVVWNNFGHEFDTADLQAYRLNAYILGQLGYSGGTITRLHQSVAPDDQSEDYLSKLELLEYDMLYGDQQAVDGDSLYETTDMRLGSREITITDAELDYRRLLVTGNNFTIYSRVVLDGQTLDTLFVDSGHIIAAVQMNDTPIGSPTEASTFERVAVAQVNSDGVELSRTPSFSLSGP